MGLNCMLGDCVRPAGPKQVKGLESASCLDWLQVCVCVCLH